MLVSDYLSSLTSSDEQYRHAAINMNFYTDSIALQQQLEQSIDKPPKHVAPRIEDDLLLDDDLPLARPAA